LPWEWPFSFQVFKRFLHSHCPLSTLLQLPQLVLQLAQHASQAT
jgi:hypothetical protein